MVLSWGLGGGVEPGSQSAAPGVWVTAADRGRFVVGGVQVRFGVSSRAVAQFQRPADLHPRSLGRPQAVQVKAAPFLVQEVPLPLSPHPSGAAWLKLKASAPPVGGVFDHTGAFYRQTSGQKGALSGELVADAWTNGDYSRLALGVRAPLRVQQLASGQYRGVCEPPEFYAKLQHNNQRFSASWHEFNGLRLSMTHAF